VQLERLDDIQSDVQQNATECNTTDSLAHQVSLESDESFVPSVESDSYGSDD